MKVNHSTSTLVASAFALALGGLAAAPAMAQNSGMMTKEQMMQKQDMTKKAVMSGKM